MSAAVPSGDLPKWQQKAREHLAKTEKKQSPPLALPTFKMGGGIAAFKPTVNSDGAKDRLKSEANIVELYTKWFNPTSVGKDTGVSCLVNCCNSTAHNRGDQNPTMDLASSSNTAICRGCDWTPDIVDLAAVAAGLAAPGTKCPPESTGLAVMFACREAFPDMQDGWTADGQYRPAPPAPIIPEGDYEDIELDEEELEHQRIATGQFAFDWRDYFPAGTPGYNWMNTLGGEATKPPDEFHFFNFLNMIALICGKDVALEDEPNVYANLYTCVVGPPGMGKSLADGYSEQVLRREYRFDKTDNSTRAVNIIGGAGSGEVLAKALHYEIPNPVPPGAAPGTRATVTKVGGVVALGKYGELSHMAAKSSNSSSTLEPMMQALYDTAASHAGGRSLSGGEYYADDYFFSASTTTQIRRMRDLMGHQKVDSGFVSRWIFILGTIKPFKGRRKPVQISGLCFDARRLGLWADDIRSNHRGLLEIPGEIGEVPEYDGFLRDKCEPLELHGMTARAGLLFKKLVLLLAINKKEPVISTETILTAQKLWKYCIDCLHFMEGTIDTTEASEEENKVQRYIESKQDTTSTGKMCGPTFSMIKRNMKKIDEYRLNQILKNKESLGLIQRVQDPRIGNRGIALNSVVYIIPR